MARSLTDKIIMHFSSALIPGKLIRRYKRFLAEVQLEDGSIVTAHCPNTGAMTGLIYPAAEVWLSKAEHTQGRKLGYTWQLSRDQNGQLVGANPGLANQLVAEALAEQRIFPLCHYDVIKREVRYGNNCRVDFVLTSTTAAIPPCYVEVKNVHWRRNDLDTAACAAFPDAVTARGTKHLRELANLTGARAVVLYVVQRNDCDSFRVAADIDPVYAQAVSAVAGAVEFMAYSCVVEVCGITLHQPLDQPLAFNL